MLLIKYSKLSNFYQTVSLIMSLVNTYELWKFQITFTLIAGLIAKQNLCKYECELKLGASCSKCSVINVLLMMWPDVVGCGAAYNNY